VSRRLIAFVAATLVAVSTLSVAMPAFLKTAVADAQSFPAGAEDDPYPVVRWNQGSSSADTIEFFGTSRFSDGDGREFATRLLAGMGIDRSQVTFEEPDGLFNGDDVQLVAYLDDHWLQATQWKNTFDVPAMAQVAAQYDFNFLDIDACPVVGTDFDFYRDTDLDYDNCKSWTLTTIGSADLDHSINVQAHPDSAFYTKLFVYLVLGTILVGALIVGGTIWLRNASLKTLESSNLVLCLVGVFLAATAVLTTFIVYLASVHTVDDVLVVHEWHWRQHVALVMGPAFITALPFLLSSILVIRAEPRPIGVPKIAAIGGVPYWMTQRAPQPQPSPPPQAPAQQWMPPPQQPPPPTSEPSSHPNPWDPPA
jgi:hypothetical protein